MARTHHQVLRLLVVWIICFLLASFSFSSPTRNRMDASAFHLWAIQQLELTDKEGTPPDKVSDAVLARLQQGKITWTQTIMATAQAWMKHEAGKTEDYPRSQAFMDALLPLLQHDPYTLPQISQLRAELSRRQGRNAEGLDHAADAHKLLLAQEYEVTSRRIANQLTAAKLAFTLGDTATAETHCLDIMSYNWTNVEDLNTLDQLRRDYVEAAQLLIRLRSGNPAALRNTYFFPAVQEELQPILDEAIEKAGH